MTEQTNHVGHASSHEGNGQQRVHRRLRDSQEESPAKHERESGAESRPFLLAGSYAVHGTRRDSPGLDGGSESVPRGSIAIGIRPSEIEKLQGSAGELVGWVEPKAKPIIGSAVGWVSQGLNPSYALRAAIPPYS
jgi:hypothetical protein